MSEKAQRSFKRKSTKAESSSSSKGFYGEGMESMDYYQGNYYHNYLDQ